MLLQAYTVAAPWCFTVTLSQVPRHELPVALVSECAPICSKPRTFFPPQFPDRISAVASGAAVAAAARDSKSKEAGRCCSDPVVRHPAPHPGRTLSPKSLGLDSVNFTN